jgi:hypothetical protein
MKTSNLVTLQAIRQDTQELFWQTEKHDFVLYEDWQMELHDEQDFCNATETAKANNYLGNVVFEHSEITAFELSQK